MLSVAYLLVAVLPNLACQNCGLCNARCATCDRHIRQEQQPANRCEGVLNAEHAPAVNVLATFGAVAFVDKLGRRKLLIIASIWMFVTQVSPAGC